ncbi:MAG: hypothetical protein U0L23_03525 [Lachnospiraceae bacterium]|nr:hypothetical protein [Lachnospiraceae bacterium]
MEVYFTYDNRGLLLEKEFYDVITKKAFEMGSPDSYRYDKEYQMVSAVYNVGEKWNYSYHYDQGKLTDFDVKYVDSGKEISCYTFDKKTGLLKEADHKSESRLCYSYEQDEHGRITKYSVKRLYYSDKDKAEEGGYRYEYDQEGNVVKGISLYSTEYTEKNFSYDKEGYMTKCEGLHSLDDYDNTPFTFRYNEQHKPITISNGYCKWEYEYGKDLVSKITYDDGVYDIKYDENNNVIELTDSADSNFDLSIEYKPYYIDKTYFDYYLSCYYYGYIGTPFDDCMEYIMHCYITEINNDVLQGKLRSEICKLPYIAREDYFVGNPFQVDE